LQLALVSPYAVAPGVVADVEVLRAFGLDLDLRVAARLRRTLLSFLEAVLVGPAVIADPDRRSA